MAIDIAIPRSRRSLLAGAVGGLAAAVTATLAGAQRVLAAGDDGQVLHVADYKADIRTTTTLANNTNNVTALRGINNQDGIGVTGFSASYRGVYGSSLDGTGVAGESEEGPYGVHARALGTTGLKVGVFGEGYSPGGVAMLGNNYATSGNAEGVQGTTDSPTGWATVGWARANGAAVVGASGPDFPSAGVPSKTGVFGYSQNGRGGVFRGPTAQARLMPTGATTHPSSGAAGDLYVDKNHRLWFCKGGTSWKQLA